MNLHRRSVASIPVVMILALSSCRKIEGTAPIAILASLLSGAPRPVNVDQPTTVVGGLEWDRCSYGQEFREGIGDCKGIGSVEDDYGATPVSFCSSDSNACNDADGLVDAPSDDARSELYYACHGAITLGKTGWRVPTLDELRTLLVCADGAGPSDSRRGCASGESDHPAVDLSLFANTVPGDYWSAESASRLTAKSVSFRRGYSDDSAYKSFKKYVRCVRNPS